MKAYLYVIILIIAIVAFTVQQIPDADFSSIENFSISHVNITTTSEVEVGNIVASVTNAIIDIMSSVVRWSVTFAKTHPTISWRLIILGVILAILSPIVLVLIKIIALVVIFTKEIIQSRKEKRILNRNEKERNNRSIRTS